MRKVAKTMRGVAAQMVASPVSVRKEDAALKHSGSLADKVTAQKAQAEALVDLLDAAAAGAITSLEEAHQLSSGLAAAAESHQAGLRRVQVASGLDAPGSLLSNELPGLVAAAAEKPWIDELRAAAAALADAAASQEEDTGGVDLAEALTRLGQLVESRAKEASASAVGASKALSS